MLPNGPRVFTRRARQTIPLGTDWQTTTKDGMDEDNSMATDGDLRQSGAEEHRAAVGQISLSHSVILVILILTISERQHVLIQIHSKNILSDTDCNRSKTKTNIKSRRGRKSWHRTNVVTYISRVRATGLWRWIHGPEPLKGPADPLAGTVSHHVWALTSGMHPL